MTNDYVIRASREKLTNISERALYRGKTNKGEWVEGYLFVDDIMKETFIISCYYSIDDGSVCIFQVLPKTVGRYMGSWDKNDVSIFEGDVLKYLDGTHQVIVGQKNGKEYFGIVMPPIDTLGFNLNTFADKMEVIGNIHDNPELVEAE